MARTLTGRLEAAALRHIDAALAGSPHPWSSGPDAPGAAFGVLGGDGLVVAGGRGTASTATHSAPTEHTVFRIASMTKSFTAAAVLRLRDRGVLGLDDPITRWVPEATGFTAAGLPPPTLDQLLAMTAGLAEDDPLGDRLQGMPPGEFDTMLAAPVAPARSPGSFEYSNFGYALIGRAISNATGQPFADYVTEHLIAPLGMTATTWTVPSVMASGYVWRDGRWCAEPVDGPGAFEAMGGLFSSVADVARWVRFLMGTGEPGVLSLASRRELAVMRTPRPAVRPSGSGPHFAPLAAAYGYGLNAALSPVLGRVVWHSGGYPGFGSSMVWLAERGVGLVILMNGRYAPATRIAMDVLHEAVAQPLEVAPGAAAVPTPADTVVAHPSFVAIRERVTALLDDLPADVPVAMNVELDEPWERRRWSLRHARAVLGAAPSLTETVMTSALHGRWRLAGQRGDAELTMMLTPTEPVQLMALDVDVAVHPSRALDDARRALAAVWNAAADGARPLPPWDNMAGVARVAGRMTGAPVVVDGDGVTWAQWRVSTVAGSWLVGVVLDASDSPATVHAAPA